jgi:4-carboxymuconolactone decarboxylase
MENDMDIESDRYRTGLALVERLHGGHAGQAMIDEMKTVCPAFAEMTIAWAFGGVMARPGLDLLTRQLALCAACVTLGNALPQLRAHLEAALALGATREQLLELILQMLFYAGGPATRNALVVAQEVFARAAPAG